MQTSCPIRRHRKFLQLPLASLLCLVLVACSAQPAGESDQGKFKALPWWLALATSSLSLAAGVLAAAAGLPLAAGMLTEHANAAEATKLRREAIGTAAELPPEDRRTMLTHLLISYELAWIGKTLEASQNSRGQYGQYQSFRSAFEAWLKELKHLASTEQAATLQQVAQAYREGGYVQAAPLLFKARSADLQEKWASGLSNGVKVARNASAEDEKIGQTIEKRRQALEENLNKALEVLRLVDELEAKFSVGGGKEPPVPPSTGDGNECEFTEQLTIEQWSSIVEAIRFRTRDEITNKLIDMLLDGKIHDETPEEKEKIRKQSVETALNDRIFCLDVIDAAANLGLGN